MRVSYISYETINEGDAVNMSTKKSKSIFLAVMAFYAAVGITACAFLFADGSSLPFIPAAAMESPYDIKPELAASKVPEETPDAVPEEDSSEEADAYYLYEVLPVSALNIRTAPDMQSDIIFTIATGTSGAVLEKGELWSRIKTPRGEGYASSRYLKFTEVSRQEYLDCSD